MKNIKIIIFFFLIFLSLNINAKILVVDDTAICNRQRKCTNTCENGSLKRNYGHNSVFHNYKTISDAVNNANDSDTIKICKGNYNESITLTIPNITFTSADDVIVPTDVNWTDREQPLLIKASGTTIENISLFVTEGYNIDSGNFTLNVQNVCLFSGNNGSDAKSDTNQTWNGNFWSKNSPYSSPFYLNNITDNTPFESCADINKNRVKIEYRMDECEWDNDNNSYEILNNGNSGSYYNASAGNDANTTDVGKICKAGNLNSTISKDKYIIPKENIKLPKNYTLSVWIKFPLSREGHKNFGSNNIRPRWINSSEIYFYNIADRPGSSSDYIYFSEDGANNWNLCINGSDYECYSYDINYLEGWHQLVFVVNDDGTNFYVDGEIELLFEEHPDSGEIGLIFNSDYGSNETNHANWQSIGAFSDEFKIFDKVLTENEIKTIYNNENVSKNYDGTDRNCTSCIVDENKTINNYKFDAWDTFRDINDRNISTKVVNSEFNLTIASLDEDGTDYQEFNGTVCVSVDNNTSRLIFLDQNSSLVTLKIDRAIKDINVHISWKENSIENCPLYMEDNSTNSTDNFAIRPEKFGLDFNTTSFYAGVDFKIDMNVTDNRGLYVKDYNESEGISFVLDKNDSNSTCISGILYKPSNLKFTDGAIVFDSNYTEVGDVNLTLKEKLGSEFAKVDADDTSKELRMIKPYSKKITFEPYRFVIFDYKFEKFPNQNWRYMSDVNESNITLSFVIQAQNKSGNPTKKFDKNCYSKDVKIGIDTISSSSDGNVSYYLMLNGVTTQNHNKSLSDFDINTTIYASNFHEANSSKIVYALNVYREFDKSKNPLDINITDINTTYINDVGVKNIGLKLENNSSSFYFGRVITNDISTNQNIKLHSIFLIVFSDKKDSFVDGYKNYSLNWYYMSKDNISNIKSLHPQKSFKYQDGDDLTPVTINPNSNVFSSKGRVDFNISNSWQESNKAYIHIKIPKYLWYNKYHDYNDSNSSDCSTHPCFEYIYYIDKNFKDIRSGTFSGTTIGDEYNATKKSKIGVKVFR